jgi:membrane associated rhomboid family serine protease
MECPIISDKTLMIPLGLGLPVLRVPIITILIASACTLKYFVNDISLNKKLEAKVESTNTNLRESTALKDLRKEYFATHPWKSDEKNVEGKNWKVEIRKNMGLALQEKEFLLALKNRSDKITGLKAFPAFSAKETAAQMDMVRFYERNHLLTDKTQTLKNYFICMFTHSGIMHLLGNMLALLAFGIYVESRMGPVTMLLSFLSAGLASFYVYVNYFCPITIPLIGASGAIAGTMGMFYICFNHHYLKFWLYFKTFLLPVKTYFPFLYILTDIATHMQGTSNVAAMAHIVGMLTGMGIVLLHPKKLKLPNPFIYAEELKFYSKIKNKDIKLTEINLFSYWLKLNPMNYLLREKLISSMWQNLNPGTTTSSQAFEVLRLNTRKAIGRSLFYKDSKSILKSLELIPTTFPLALFVDDFNNKDLVKIYNLCLKKRSLLAAVRVSCVLLDREINNELQQTLIENIASSSVEIEEAQYKQVLNHCQNKEAVRKIIHFSSTYYRETA